jgi:hypothetical protein
MATMQILKKLDKTRQSIGNQYFRLGYEAYRKDGELKWSISPLLDRYNDLKGLAIEAGIWETYCHQKGFCTTHTANDLLA